MVDTWEFFIYFFLNFEQETFKKEHIPLHELIAPIVLFLRLSSMYPSTYCT